MPWVRDKQSSTDVKIAGNLRNESNLKTNVSTVLRERDSEPSGTVDEANTRECERLSAQLTVRMHNLQVTRC